MVVAYGHYHSAERDGQRASNIIKNQRGEQDVRACGTCDRGRRDDVGSEPDDCRQHQHDDDEAEDRPTATLGQLNTPAKAAKDALSFDNNGRNIDPPHGHENESWNQYQERREADKNREDDTADYHWQHRSQTMHDATSNSSLVAAQVLKGSVN